MPMPRTFPASADRQFVQIVDSAVADATSRSGKWLACRPGCTQCCVGVFAINQLDVLRLQRGLAELEKTSPDRAQSVRFRAQHAVARLSAEFPGNPVTGILDEGDDAERRFSEFGNDEVCPALDPATGLCELYEHRPVTCRVFGLPIRSEDGIGVCELCFQGATDTEVLAAELNADPNDDESALLRKLEKTTGTKGNTVIAFCLST